MPTILEFPSVNWPAYGIEALQEMRDAGAMIMECQRVLLNARQNIVSELIRFTGNFREWDHLPEQDVHDHQSHSQYYYHTHAKSTDPDYPHNAEHGHFHVFLREKGMPLGIKPSPFHRPQKKADPVSHIVGIIMDDYGVPTGLFTTNRWVTNETWYKAEDVIKMMKRYEIDHTFPSWPVNLWVTNMLRLFRPQIETLLTMRDKTIENWKSRMPNTDILENRDLEVTSMCTISIADQIETVDRFSRLARKSALF
ncbi:MAG: hypothetical protein GC185_12615 [Alphaproteobacteria bacterium]|nr:hypothetical protein [Alphaproteobacteria bacterium]